VTGFIRILLDFISAISQWPRNLGMNCLRSLERWDRGFESHSRYGFLCAFNLFLCSVCG
jgi:hypothetical protein